MNDALVVVRRFRHRRIFILPRFVYEILLILRLSSFGHISQVDDSLDYVFLHASKQIFFRVLFSIYCKISFSLTRPLTENIRKKKLKKRLSQAASVAVAVFGTSID